MLNFHLRAFGGFKQVCVGFLSGCCGWNSGELWEVAWDRRVICGECLSFVGHLSAIVVVFFDTTASENKAIHGVFARAAPEVP